MNKEKLIQAAIKARENAYTPYSHFKVGAALLTKNDEIFIGCNIENSSYGLCICAERNCLFGAYARGVKKDDIVAFAVVADTKGPCSPCGACRQVISELVPENALIILTNLNNDSFETSPSKLLPFAFDGSDL